MRRSAFGQQPARPLHAAELAVPCRGAGDEQVPRAPGDLQERRAYLFGSHVRLTPNSLVRLALSVLAAPSAV